MRYVHPVNVRYLSGYVNKRTIKAWLDALQQSTLYKMYNINVDLNRLNFVPTSAIQQNNDQDPIDIEEIDPEVVPESEVLAARQHTMLWNEEQALDIAPGSRATPLNIIFDRHSEELSFPKIYFGEPRRFSLDISVTPYMITTSEIRRRDRRGATPEKVLYMAMKLLRLRMVDGIYQTFKSVSSTEHLTRRMLEDKQFLDNCVEKNLTFLKSVPNSVQYWSSRKRDLFAMIRQLGKPTMFLTLSANEIRWPKFLDLLNKLSKRYPGLNGETLNRSQRCTLVSEDPVTCCVYFQKLVNCIMSMLRSKQSYNPFGRYRVLDFFIRIEFQHRGSPHAHILLWLNDDPQEKVSENMPNTIALLETLCSVNSNDLPEDSMYSNQVHKHTFTCYKRGEITCRFGIPYWPMKSTCILLPLPQSNSNRKEFQLKAKLLRQQLELQTFTSIDDFLSKNEVTESLYFDIIRATLRKPTILFRRDMKQLFTNTYNPWIAGTINSNMDLQFILDEYSCATTLKLKII